LRSSSLCIPRAREPAEGLGPSPDPGLFLDDQTSLFDAVNLIRRRVNFGAFDSLFDFAGPDSFACRQPTPAGHTLSATPATFSPYVGTSTVPLGVVGILGTSFGNPPALRVRINGDELIGSVTFRHDFPAVAVPHPSTLMLSSVATLLWLVVIRSRPRDQVLLDMSACLFSDTVNPRGPKGTE
jgi:hypothetical protein